MVFESQQTRVLVVSASPYTRYVISGELSSEPDLFVVGTARTPDEVAYKQSLLQPNLMVVDLESRQDLTDLYQTLLKAELPILVLCARTQEGAELAFAALEAGAIDIVPRPDGGFGIIDYRSDLLRKIRGVAQVTPHHTPWQWNGAQPREKATSRRFGAGDRVIIVSASTGGIDPLVQVLGALPGDLNAMVLVLAPLPSLYLNALVQRINPIIALPMRKVRDGLSIKSNMVYLTPCDYQLDVGSGGRLILGRDLRQKEERISMDRTLNALAMRYGPAVIAVILSGIGRDGVQGARDVRAAGGTVIVQEVSTCVAGETPASVIQGGGATVTLPPERIAEEIRQRVMGQPLN